MIPFKLPQIVSRLDQLTPFLRKRLFSFLHYIVSKHPLVFILIPFQHTLPHEVLHCFPDSAFILAGFSLQFIQGGVFPNWIMLKIIRYTFHSKSVI
ncbi:hypothetical protein BB65665_18357 [Bacillus sp. 916]|nr:hypothetical protein KO64_14280 [Bacillus subtilis]EJD66071.1 hypothetical protein BB65665_18357 [Bacillus sp. 916]